MEPLDVASLLAEPAPVCWDRLTATNSPVADAGGNADTAGLSPPADDPLALALPWLVRHLGLAGALAATMASDDAAQSPEAQQVLPALRRIGFDARLSPCPVERLRQVPVPAVLLLRGGDACVLTSSRLTRSGQVVLHVVMPGQPPLAFDVPASDLAPEYTGMALLVRPLDLQPTTTAAVAGVAAARGADPLHAPLSRLAMALEAARKAAMAPPPPAPDQPAPGWGGLAAARRWLSDQAARADGLLRALTQPLGQPRATEPGRAPAPAPARH